MPRLACSFAIAAAALACVAAPRSYWTPHSTPVERLDVAPFDALLREHVHEGRVDYAALARSPAFAGWMAALRRSRFTRETTRAQRLAYWINAYNACAIQGVIEGGSPATLLGRARFFQRRRCAVGSEEITLQDLEHRRLRPLGDVRIHFAIVCASASCPVLASEAYVAERLDAQLDRAAREFVNDPTRNRFDPIGGTADLSAIFDEFADDFGADDSGLAAYIARYTNDPEVTEALVAGRLALRTLAYDWSLNGSPP